LFYLNFKLNIQKKKKKKKALPTLLNYNIERLKRKSLENEIISLKLEVENLKMAATDVNKMKKVLLFLKKYKKKETLISIDIIIQANINWKHTSKRKSIS